MRLFTLIKGIALPQFCVSARNCDIEGLFFFPSVSDCFFTCMRWSGLCWLLKENSEDLRFLYVWSSLFYSILIWLPQPLWSHQTLSPIFLFMKPERLCLGWCFLHGDLGLHIANWGNHGSQNMFYVSQASVLLCSFYIYFCMFFPEIKSLNFSIIWHIMSSNFILDLITLNNL